MDPAEPGRAAHDLTAQELRWRCDPSTIPVPPEEEERAAGGSGDTTADTMDPGERAAWERTLGQERAQRALEFGVGMSGAGYNLFVVGDPATGRDEATIAMLATRARAAHAAGAPSPSDLVYVHRPDAPERLRALELPAGRGRRLRGGLDALLAALRLSVPRLFEGEEHETRRRAVLEDFQTRSRGELSGIESEAQRRGFQLRPLANGVGLVPTLAGRPLSQDEFEKLPPAEQQRFHSELRDLEERVAGAVRRLRDLDRGAGDALHEMERGLLAQEIDRCLEPLRQEFVDRGEVIEHLEQMRRALLDAPELRVAEAQSASGPAPGVPAGSALVANLLEESQRAASRAVGAPFPPAGAVLDRYRAQLVVEHVPGDAPPVVTEPHPTFANLFGRIDGPRLLGEPLPGPAVLKAGALHRAQGGTLVLDAMQLLRTPFAWETLERILLAGELGIEDPPDPLRLLPASPIHLDPVPLRVKVVLLGRPELYALLRALDERFRELFKVKIEFTPDAPRSDENVRAVARFVERHARREKLRRPTREAVAALVEEAVRMAEDREKLSARVQSVADLVSEASFWAASEGAAEMAPAHVARAVEELRFRHGFVEDRLRDVIRRGLLVVATEGETVGQVNGLAVLGTGDHSFGAPTRVTARTFAGQSGVVNIEREVRLSGRIHAKGVLTLAGYLGGRYAADRPLALSALLAFEQMYDEIEGDSAASAELYALLSSLAQLPIRQGIAVTGSVNQFGEVQAVGGLMRKIEGFYDVCAARGLDGTQGVIIPRANVRGLMLRGDVVDAVAAGRFHVYAVSHVDEGIELLTGVPASTSRGNGADDRSARPEPGDTVHGRVERRLAELLAGLREAGAPAAGPFRSLPPPTLES